MNSSLSAGASAPPPRAEAPSCRRAEARGPSRRGDEFERVLRDKAGGRDAAAKRNEAKGDAAARPDDAAEQDDALAQACAAAQAPALPLLAPLLAPHPGGGAAAAITAPPGARGAVDESAAARSLLAHAPPGVLGAADAAATWQVHLPAPLGAGLELRATRMQESAQAQPGWALSIASPAHEAALLARHAPRLDERLRARALEVSHVRIERDDRDSSGEEGA